MDRRSSSRGPANNSNTSFSIVNDDNLGEWQLCPKCNGEGQVHDPIGDGMSTNPYRTCPVCNGAKILARPRGGIDREPWKTGMSNTITPYTSPGFIESGP